MRILLAALLATPLLAAGQTPAPPVANSPLQWDLREGTHPRMGPITVAVPSSSVVTPVGKEKINSLVFFSCEKSRGMIAIELANAAESNARGGLPPRQMPRLMCNPRNVSAARTEIATTWTVNEIGDALARGLNPADLRRCASIDVVQDVALPKGWTAETQHIEIELIPYKKELDVVIGSCREMPLVAAAPVVPAAPVAPPPAQPSPPPVAPPPVAAPKTVVPAPVAIAPPRVEPARVEPPRAEIDANWKRARTISVGRTNVRASPSIDAAAVTQLPPGMPLLVQPSGSDWFKARPRSGNAFSGYIRQDRLAFE